MSRLAIMRAGDYSWRLFALTDIPLPDDLPVDIYKAVLTDHFNNFAGGTYITDETKISALVNYWGYDSLDRDYVKSLDQFRLQAQRGLVSKGECNLFCVTGGLKI